MKTKTTKCKQINQVFISQVIDSYLFIVPFIKNLDFTCFYKNLNLSLHILYHCSDLKHLFLILLQLIKVFFFFFFKLPMTIPELNTQIWIKMIVKYHLYLFSCKRGTCAAQSDNCTLIQYFQTRKQNLIKNLDL